jgi:diguanylate cyclase (GGDEF)-like protein/PAS domain S-box-containing protein
LIEQSKTKQGLIQDCDSLRRRIEELERSESAWKKEKEALKKAERRFRSYFNLPLHGIAITSPAKEWIEVNDRICSILGYAREAIVRMTWSEMTHPDDLAADLSEFDHVLSGQKDQYHIEKRFIRKDGKVIWTHLSVGCVRKPDGSVDHIVATIDDITNAKSSEEALRQSEERYRTLVENASDIVFKTDDAGYFTFVNDAVRRTMGYEEEEMIGRHYLTVIRPDMREEAGKLFGRQFVKRIPNTYSEFPVIVKDGGEIWLGQNTQLIYQGGKAVAFQSLARDITDRKRIAEALRESENRYRELSIVDDLTRLYNSRHFYHQLRMEIDRADRYGQPLTLLLLDLDDFKAFNDAYGHIEGDQVLSRLGRVVKRCLRQTDSAYRYGGEEFTVLLPMTTGKDGAVTAERIRTEFQEEIFSPAAGQDLHMTVSIGLGQYKPPEDMKAFVHRVDQLMYEGKKNGKNRACWSPSQS